LRREFVHVQNHFAKNGVVHPYGEREQRLFRGGECGLALKRERYREHEVIVRVILINFSAQVSFLLALGYDYNTRTDSLPFSISQTH
jgi:hypothetical protein